MQIIAATFFIAPADLWPFHALAQFLSGNDTCPTTGRYSQSLLDTCEPHPCPRCIWKTSSQATVSSAPA
jgi:hypothetical protein